jgi:DNA-binding response OmpR family regulator
MNQEHILLVEDDPLWRGVVERRLSGAGYAVESVTNGQEALEWLDSAEALPAAVLTVLLMPLADGYAVCAGVRAHAGGAELPIILMTAVDGAEYRARAAQFGVFRYLTKPVPAAELLQTVAAAVGHA